MTGTTVGTPAYMSPEQAAGEVSLDARTDQYSLACVLWEMLAGEPPFSGPTAQVMLTRRFTETPPHLRQIRDTVPEGVEHAVAKALSRSPEDRFASVAEFGNALRDGLVEERAAVRPRRSLLVAIPLGVLLALGLLLGWLHSRAPASAARRPAARSAWRCCRSRTSAGRRTRTSPTASPTRSGASSPGCRGCR